MGAAISANAQDIERIPLRLVVGQQVSLPAKNVVKYSEGVQGIIDIRLPRDGEEFIVVGLRDGTSTLLLIYENGKKVQYDISVKPVESKVTRRENIRLDFYFVELTDNDNLKLGVAWPQTIGTGTIEANIDLRKPGASAGFLQITGHALPRLDILQTAGWAKVSRQSAVITANGSQASFNSGGEVNIAVAGALAAEIRQIQFGSNVKVLPRYDSESGRLEMQIEAEFSSLSAASAGDVPGRSVSNLSTIVNVEMGQTVMLAGINSQSEGRSKDGIPFLSQIPILGAFFGSHGRRQDTVQNVVFIVPSVVDLVGDPARRRIRDALKVYGDYDGGLERPVFVKPGDPKGSL
jgi:pilus assembly protein CpaC